MCITHYKKTMHARSHLKNPLRTYKRTFYGNSKNITPNTNFKLLHQFPLVNTASDTRAKLGKAAFMLF